MDCVREREKEKGTLGSDCLEIMMVALIEYFLFLGSGFVY